MAGAGSLATTLAALAGVVEAGFCDGDAMAGVGTVVWANPILGVSKRATTANVPKAD
jgi:hypothetical protein